MTKKKETRIIQTKTGPQKFEIIKFKTGRPPKYKNAKELEKKIDEYFNTGMNTKKIVIKDNIVEVPIPTMAGLTLFLGFCDVNSLREMEKDDRFFHIIKKARLSIQRFYEENLNSGSCTGSIFWLKNWADYKDKTEVDNNIKITEYKIEFGNAELLDDTTK